MGAFGAVLLVSTVTLLAGGGLSKARANVACVQTAKADFQSCVSQCKATFAAARLTCRNVQPACGLACLAGRQACVDNAQAILQTGHLPDGSTLANCSDGTDQCKASLQAAKSTCRAPCSPSDQACLECVDSAEVTDFQCRDTCGDSWRTNRTVAAMLQSCQSSFKSCIRQCPPAAATTPTTVP